MSLVAERFDTSDITVNSRAGVGVDDGPRRAVYDDNGIRECFEKSPEQIVRVRHGTILQIHEQRFVRDAPDPSFMKRPSTGTLVAALSASKSDRGVGVRIRTAVFPLTSFLEPPCRRLRDHAFSP
jgi:hypothetical protein